jgi:hypothetical protein
LAPVHLHQEVGVSDGPLVDSQRMVVAVESVVSEVTYGVRIEMKRWPVVA